MVLDWSLTKSYFLYLTDYSVRCTGIKTEWKSPVGAMRSFKLNVWMMPLSKRSFSECWGVMCQLLGQQQEPGSGHFIYIPSHGGREC